MSPRPSAPTFPPQDDSSVERPSHADSSHVARRRASSAPAHEVDLDEVELFDDAPPAPSPPPPPPPRLSVVAPEPPLPALRPLRSSRPVFQVPIALESARGKSRVVVIVVSTLLAATAGAVAAVVTRPAAPRGESVTTPQAASVAPAPPIPTAVAPSATAIPVVDVAKLPRAKTGVIVGAEGHRLWIDGALAPTWQASVGCGSHVVQVGSAGVPRTVDVPCGETVTVSP